MVAVLYDFDGLLVDSETAGLVSWRDIYEEFGHELDIAWWLAELSAGRGPCMPREQLAEAVGAAIDWEEVEARRLRRRDELLVLRPGAADHLDACERLGVRKAIVSNAPDWWITERLSACGIDIARFDAVMTKSAGLAKKPAPDSYLAVLEELGVPADSAVAFEDSPIGVRAAQAAGVACVAIPNFVTANFDLGEADLVLPALHSRPLEEVLDALRPAWRSEPSRQQHQTARHAGPQRRQGLVDLGQRELGGDHRS
ncbi:HAD family hydrolase [Streptomyces sp. 4N509B]|uniref:HAD family hydrolase n=1 Tax=Streptomyces sp. 4N509B TaxID=3457413 RepID=UPI003FD48CF6